MHDRHIALRSGEKVLIRQLTPDDVALYPDFLSEVTREDLRLRFFMPMREVSEQLLDRLVHYDPTRAMVFIALEEATGKLLGVVRLHDDPGGKSGEFAIIVRARLKGHGLGWALMQHMIAFARAKGLRRVRGQVLAENTSMLRMCDELGFHIGDDPSERGVKTVELPLADLPQLAASA